MSQDNLVTALLGVEGVAGASVEPLGDGPGTLRLQLTPGSDEVAVAGAVNRLLRSRFGLAVDADRVQVLEETGRPAVSARLERTPIAAARPAPRVTSPFPRPLASVARVEPARKDPARNEPIRNEPPSKEPASTQPASTQPASNGSGRTEEDRKESARTQPWREVKPAGQEPPATSPAATRAPTEVFVEVDSIPEEGESALELGEGDTPAGQPTRRGRLAIQRVQLLSAGLGVAVTVTLGMDGETFPGEAEGSATTSGVHRSVAAATLRAVEQVVQGGARFEVDQVELTRLGADQTVLVLVTMLTGRSTQRLTGAAVVREDVRQAVIRAVLAAVNRRLEVLLEQIEPEAS
ncbi:MAG: hypothetical protein QOI54_990 [Actinomycetota bacterium]|nr:hypothetical protein [Actinomycetota bacterium]